MIKFIKQRYYLLDISFGNYAVCGDVLVTCLADIHLSSSHQQGGLTAAQCWLASLVSKQTFQHAQLTQIHHIGARGEVVVFSHLLGSQSSMLLHDLCSWQGY